MRNVLFKLLTIIIVLLLVANFVRFFFIAGSSGDTRSQAIYVDTFMTAFSNIGADPTPVFNDLYNVSYTLVDVCENFYSLFYIPKSESAWDVIKGVFNIIKNIFTFQFTLFDNVFSFLAESLSCIYNLAKFFYEFIISIFKFLNTILGSTFKTRGGVGEGGGFSGGGFGGRR